MFETVLRVFVVRDKLDGQFTGLTTQAYDGATRASGCYLRVINNIGDDYVSLSRFREDNADSVNLTPCLGTPPR